MYIEDFLNRLSAVRGSRNQFSAKCPAHDDRRASLSITQGDDGKILLKCHAGCTNEKIVSALGLKMSDLFSEDNRQNSTYYPEQSKQPKQLTNEISNNAIVYDYESTDGNVIAKKLRYPNKSFCWFSRNPKNGNFETGRSHCKEALLYNMYDCRNANALYIVEGEKDVETLKRYRQNAVSFPDGAKSKWKSEYENFFKDKTVAIIQDNDNPGKTFAQMLALRLYDVAKSVRIIDLTRIWEDIPEKADISDYLGKYPDGLENLSQLANSTEEWKPVIDMSKYVHLSEIECCKTDWLWYPYIPLGKITIITADPGTGKTFLSLYLASVVSTGRPFYGQELYNEPGIVVYQTAEDGIADTLKPRLVPMNPDFENIYVYNEENESLSLSDDKIEQIMKELHPRLMVFDPLQAYLGAKIDMHRANEVRPVLGRIAHLAEKYNCAVVFVMHNNKMSSQSSAMYRLLGSIDIPAVARSILILGKDPENPDNGKIMCHEKSSLTSHGRSIKFEIDPKKNGIVFNGFSNLKANEVLSFSSETKNKSSVKLNSVVEDLLELFGENDYIVVESVKSLYEELGCSKGTLYTAKNELELQSLSVGFGKEKITYWLLPDVDINTFQTEHSVIPTDDNNKDLPFDDDDKDLSFDDDRDLPFDEFARDLPFDDDGDSTFVPEDLPF